MKKLTIALLLILAGCAGQPATTNYYLLRQATLPETRQLQPSAEYGLANVTIATYIDQPGLVMETPSGEYRAARYSQWAEPLRQSVQSFLAREISRDYGEDILPLRVSETPTGVHIRIDQLHGTNTGEALIAAVWWLRNDDGLLASHQFSKKVGLKSDGYAALVEAEESLLSELGSAVAKTLAKP